MPAAITSSKPAAAQLLAHQGEELLVARLDDLGERLARQPPRAGDRPTLGTSMLSSGLASCDSAHA